MSQYTSIADIAAAAKEFERTLNTYFGEESIEVNVNLLDVTTIERDQKRHLFEVRVVSTKLVHP